METTNFETIAQVIKHRRAIFPPSYTKREIPKSLLTELLDCANSAPTHKLTQPWRFIIFREGGLVRLADQLAHLYKTHTYIKPTRPKRSSYRRNTKTPAKRY